MFMVNRLISNIVVGSTITILFGVLLVVNLFSPVTPETPLIPVVYLPVEINNMLLQEIALNNINSFIDRNIVILSLMDHNFMVPIPNGIHFLYSQDPIISSTQQIIVEKILMLGDIPLQERNEFLYNIWLLKIANPSLYEYIQHSIPISLVMHM